MVTFMQTDIATIDLYKAMCDRCREAYVMSRARVMANHTGGWNTDINAKWDGGQVPVRKSAKGGTEVTRYKTVPSIWPKIAIFMLDNYLDPDACVEYCFRQQLLQPGKSRREVFPTDIPQSRHLAAYKSLNRRDKDIIATNLQTQKQICVVALSDAQEFDMGLEYVLLDTNLELSALFRFCLAEAEGLELANVFAVPAVVQYMANASAYVEVWDEWLPDGFAEDVVHCVNRARRKACDAGAFRKG